MSASTVETRDGSVQVASSPGRVVIDVQTTHDFCSPAHADLKLDLKRAVAFRAELSRHIRLARQSQRIGRAGRS